MRYLLGLLFAAGIFTAQGAQLAIIIDDIGYRDSDEAVLSLPSEITLAVIPQSPTGAQLANTAHLRGFEVMLHLPMQAINGKALGPGGITKAMDEEETKQIIDNAIQRIPFARGANNHMGSLLTQEANHMLWVMERLKKYNLYFVDSRTTDLSKAANQAELLGVPNLRRQVFLDNDTKETALEQQFNLMIALTHQQGMTVAIAHPHPETIKFLKTNLQRLTDEGISLVPASQLLPLGLQEQDKASLAATPE